VVVFWRREWKGDAVAFDRDPKLNCEEGGTEREGRTGVETNTICRQKQTLPKHTEIHTTFDYRDAYKHHTI